MSPNRLSEVADLGVRYNFAPQDDCRLCHILYRSRQIPKSSTRPYHLRVYSYLRSSKIVSFGTFPESQLERDIPCLGVVPADFTGTQFRLYARDTGQLFCVEDGQPAATIFTPRLVGKNADFLQFKEWLNFCKSFHAQCQGSEDQVDGLKLIDCISGSIVAAPQNATYVALSHVWGQTDSDVAQASTSDKPFETLSSGFSKTVEDAILVTKSLGYQFLWVDKFCIDQNNPEEKHHQISQMDTIYGVEEKVKEMNRWLETKTSTAPQPHCLSMAHQALTRQISWRFRRSPLGLNMTEITIR